MANVTIEISEAELAEFEATWEDLVAQMREINRAIQKDRKEIDKLRIESQQIAAQTRAILEQLQIQVGL